MDSILTNERGVGLTRDPWRATHERTRRSSRRVSRAGPTSTAITTTSCEVIFDLPHFLSGTIRSSAIAGPTPFSVGCVPATLAHAAMTFLGCASEMLQDPRYARGVAHYLFNFVKGTPRRGQRYANMPLGSCAS